MSQLVKEQRALQAAEKEKKSKNALPNSCSCMPHAGNRLRRSDIAPWLKAAEIETGKASKAPQKSQ
jgi:hypothetical protein